MHSRHCTPSHWKLLQITFTDFHMQVGRHFLGGWYLAVHSPPPWWHMIAVKLTAWSKSSRHMRLHAVHCVCIHQWHRAAHIKWWGMWHLQLQMTPSSPGMKQAQQPSTCQTLLSQPVLGIQWTQASRLFVANAWRSYKGVLSHRNIANLIIPLICLGSREIKPKLMPWKHVAEISKPQKTQRIARTRHILAHCEILLDPHLIFWQVRCLISRDIIQLFI